MSKKILKKLVQGFILFHVLLIIGGVFTHCTFSQYAKKSYEQAKLEKPYDVVIVPGVPYEGEETTAVMKMRLYWAKYLYDSGFTKNIIFSGSSVYSPYIESVVMKTMADTLGIPAEHTFSETKAEHSTENAYYGWKMAQELGFKKIALASDPFQAGMLRSFIRRYCPGMKAIPIIFDKMNIDEKTLPRIDPSAAYVSDFVPLPRREGFWKRFRGTMGKRVKDEAKERETIEEVKGN